MQLNISAGMILCPVARLYRYLSLRKWHKVSALLGLPHPHRRPSARSHEPTSSTALTISMHTSANACSVAHIPELVQDIVKSDRFNVKHLPGEFYDATNIVADSTASCSNPEFPGEMFIFRNGVISFWNIRGDAVDGILSLSRRYAEDIYPARVVNWESEEMPYLYHDGPTMFKDVKLGHWEHKLDALIASLDPIPASLIKGHKLKYHTPQAMLRKIGEIQLIRFLNISQRVHLMNEKLNYCAHMVELLKSDLHERRSLRLEVVFEVLHLFVLPRLNNAIEPEVLSSKPD